MMWVLKWCLAQDWVWVSTWRASSFTFSQGEVVVYVSPKDPYDYLIKRVVALEGDIVSSDRSATGFQVQYWVID